MVASGLYLVLHLPSKYGYTLCLSDTAAAEHNMTSFSPGNTVFLFLGILAFEKFQVAKMVLESHLK